MSGLFVFPPTCYNSSLNLVITTLSRGISVIEEMGQDVQTVTPDGKRVMSLIEGVKVRYALTQADERGSLTEIYDTRWGFHDLPLVFVYTSTINPGAAKAWIKHDRQDDRLFFLSGSVKVVLYDDRPESSTQGMINEFVFTVSNRALLTVPSGVWHGLVNVSNVDVVFMNMPTRPYDYASPDKIRLPADTNYIPYDLLAKPAW
jgi:dTDP-4-dehydrorhamnose 3,5-epimerase